jgi:hypothetical protein
LIAIDASVATNFLDVFDTLVPGRETDAAAPDLPSLRHVLLVDNQARPTAKSIHSLTADEEDLDEVSSTGPSIRSPADRSLRARMASCRSVDPGHSWLLPGS